MDLRTSRAQQLAVALSLVASLVFTAILVGSFGGPSAIPGGGRLELRAAFRDALGLQPAADVRIRGVDVGKVASVERDGGSAAVRLRFRDEAVRLLTQGTTARIGLKTPLGEAFVDVKPGATGAPTLRADAKLRTRPSVTFGAALRALGAETYADTDGILTALDRSMRRPGTTAGLAATVGQGRRIAGAFRGLTEALRGQEPAIAALVGNTRVAVDALAAHQRSMKGVVDHGAATLAALAANRRDLEAGLAELEPVTRSATRTLAALDPALREAAPLVDELVAAAPDLTSALRRLPAVARQAASILAGAPRLTAAAQPVLRDARPLLAAAGPALDALAPALANLVPVARHLEPRINSLVAWFTNTGSVGASGDSTSRWVRFLLFIEPGILAGIEDATPGNTYTRPNDALANQPYVPGSYERLRAHAPSLGGRR